MKDNRCPHLRKQLGLVKHRNGAHRMEKCLDCGANVRGAGVWVSKAECPADDSALPVFADHGKEAEGEGLRQRSLFERL